MKIYYVIPAAIVVLIVLVFMFGRIDLTPEQQVFKKLCESKDNQWMLMEPMKNGVATSDKKCWGCMADDMNMICDSVEYQNLKELA